MDETVKVSVVIPTLNSASTLRQCLASIARQGYPKDRLEFLFADGGSRDATRAIIAEFQKEVHPAVVKVLDNPLSTGEAGKAVGAKAASGDIVCFLDSDNVLPGDDWLRKMVLPFSDPQIIGAEPLEYTYRRKDGFIVRYGALMGLSDPLCLFLGNYDRFNHLTGRWTDIPLKVEDTDGYYKVFLESGRMPTFGANGFFIRRSVLNSCPFKEYLFDVDVIYALLDRGKKIYAKVKVGIIHLFASNVKVFARKQKRRLRDFLYYRKTGIRNRHSGDCSKAGIAKFIIYCVLVFPLFLQSSAGFLKKRDGAWFFHPLACWVTLWVYTMEFIKGSLVKGTIDRKGWRQG